MPDSSIDVRTNGGASYVGPDAVNLFRCATLRASIQLHMRCGLIPTRGVTITRLFAMATEYTGKRYKRGAHAQCVADLDVWIATMKTAIPTTVDGVQQ